MNENQVEKLEKALALLDDVIVELGKDKPGSQEHAEVKAVWHFLDSITSHHRINLDKQKSS